jgi:hypothetical protein
MGIEYHTCEDLIHQPCRPLTIENFDEQWGQVIQSSLFAAHGIDTLRDFLRRKLNFEPPDP